MDDEKRGFDDTPTDDLNLKEVHRVWGLAEADVIKSFLESNGIVCIYRGLVVPSIYSFTTDGMGEIRIMVKEADFETAKALLEKPELPPEEA
jgi:Putative prokaryotic signal transducing protein